MGIIDYLYMGIIGGFSLSGIIYGVRLIIKIRKESIEQFNKHKKQNKIKFEDYGRKH